MSNNYCTIAQMKTLLDERVLDQLSADDLTASNATNQQALLDMQASELESVLQGRYSLPPRDSGGNVPLILTKWVGVTAAYRHYARRAAMNPVMQADYDWAMDWLELLREGKVGIPGVDKSAVMDFMTNGSGPEYGVSQPYDTLMDRTSLIDEGTT